MDSKILFLGCILLLISIATISEAKKRRSYTKLEYNQMSDERMCQRKRCGKRPKGSWCQVTVDENGLRQPACVCPQTCDATDQSPVCSIYGRQYDNKCFLHLEACKKRKNIKIAYEGRCIASQAKCHPEELRQFPFRLMDWFVHLKSNDEFGTVDPRKSVTSISNEDRESVAQWKFEVLDRNHDGKLTNKELKQFRYALMPLEHCAKDFFKVCDLDKNRKIQSNEWNTCLLQNGWNWYEERIGQLPSSDEHTGPSNDEIQ